ncbi:hypothetical protein [Limnohabitans sp.]|uniref:hypothetical protein n=1 Tax=Limnohabitans sp. TaxID=1907725 RepID=UPI0025C19687|nr:hypothetical protein [Limnohabitans sp.]
MTEKIFFDLDKLKANDPAEIKKVAKQYAAKKLSSKQVGLIAYHAKPALDAIQAIAREISKSQENAFKGNAHSTDGAYTFSQTSQKYSRTSEEKRDAYRHAENLQRKALESNERMNASNNSLWGKVAIGVLALGAAVAYARSK